MVIFQSVLLLFGLFVCPLSESRSVWYINHMPEIKHYSNLIAEIICPIIIFFLCLWAMLSLPNGEGADRLHNGAPYFFVLLSQFSIILCFMLEYFAGFKSVYEDYWLEERKVLLMVKASLAGLDHEIMASASSVVFDVDPASDSYR